MVAIFATNLPEALGGALGMRNKGRSRRFTVAVWAATGVLLAAAVVVGNVAFADVDKEALALAWAFAGGAVLASTADTIMPEAYD